MGAEKREHVHKGKTLTGLQHLPLFLLLRIMRRLRHGNCKASVQSRTETNFKKMQYFNADCKQRAFNTMLDEDKAGTILFF